MDESSDRKRCREDNPEEPSPSSGQSTTNKKKRRKKKNKGDPQTPKEKAAEPVQGSEVIPNHQTVDTVIPIVPEHDPLISITVEENPRLCSKIELAAESGNEKGVGVGVGHDESTNKGTFLKKKENNVLKPQGAETNEANPQLCSKPEAAPLLDLAIPVVQENNEGAEPRQINAGNPTLTPKVESALPVNLEMKKEAEANEPQAEHPKPEPCSEADPAHSEDPTTTIQQSRKKRKNRSGRKKIKCSEEKVENQSNPLQCSLDQIQPDSAIPLCTKPSSPIDQAILAGPATKVDTTLSACPKPVETIIGQTIPLSQAIPIDTEQKMVKKERTGTLDGAESNEHNTEPPETLVQTAICPIAAAPIGPAIPTDSGQKMTKKERKKRRKSALKSAGGDLATLYPEQMMPQKKRKTKQKIALISEGTEPNKHDGKPHETQLQRSMCPIAATPIDPTIPMDQIIPIDPATTICPEQKMPQKKRKKKRKSALISEGTELNKHDGKPHETQFQISMCPIAATPIDPTVPMDQIIPVDPATPIYPEQKMPQKKRKKKRKSALKSEGEEPNKHIAKQTVETPLLGIKGSTVSNVPFDLPRETSLRCNAKPLAKTRFQSTEGLKVTKVPFKRRGESSMICRACQQRGHRFEVCPRLKCLSEDEEICFFCGEIGHSLGKCSVSKAGGGRLAKCLFCYARGHFSNNCPRNGHGIDPKDVAAIGLIIKMETEEKPVAEVTTM